jgi:hypothetical protein
MVLSIRRDPSRRMLRRVAATRFMPRAAILMCELNP